MSLSPIWSLMLITALLACQFLVSHAHRDRLMEEDTKVHNDGVAGDDQPSLTHSLIQEGDDNKFAEWTEVSKGRSQTTQETSNSRSRNVVDQTQQKTAFGGRLTGTNEQRYGKTATFNQNTAGSNSNQMNGFVRGLRSGSETDWKPSKGAQRTTETLTNKDGSIQTVTRTKTKDGGIQTVTKTVKTSTSKNGPALTGGYVKRVNGDVSEGQTVLTDKAGRRYKIFDVRDGTQGNTNIRTTHKMIHFTTSKTFTNKINADERKEHTILQSRIDNSINNLLSQVQAQSQRTGTLSQGFQNRYVSRQGGKSFNTVQTSDISSNSKTQPGAKSNIKQTSRTTNGPGSYQHVEETTTETSRSGDGFVRTDITKTTVTKTVYLNTIKERGNPENTDGTECVNSERITNFCKSETGYRCRSPEADENEMYNCFCIVRQEFDALSQTGFLETIKEWLSDGEGNLVVDEESLKGMTKDHCQKFMTSKMKHILQKTIQAQVQDKIDKLEAEELTAGSDCGEGAEGKTEKPLVIGKD